MFGALAGLLAVALRLEGLRARRAAVAAALLAALYGSTDELHQASTPGRDASIADLLADAIGATLGAALAATLPDPRGAPAAPSDTGDP